MKTFTITINDIRSWEPEPCYDPALFLPEGWRGTALDILAVENCPAEDRLWVVLRQECIDARTLRLFAVWCARQALALIDDPDQRSIAACDIAERYANGDATSEELAAASDAAWGAAWAAAWAAARDAARGAARDAASDAAWAAARGAARGAARDAARGAARDAASDAAWAAASDAARAAASDAAWAAARDAARGAARDAAWAAQLARLREMLAG